MSQNPNILPNLLSSDTLSFRYIPGQDKLYQSTNTESIFSFGDFRIQRNINNNFLIANSQGLSFDRYQNLKSLSSSDFDVVKTLYLNENDLNPDLSDPNSYSYFGSYYTKLAVAINDIIQNFPYAILCYDGNTGTTNTGYLLDYGTNTTYLTLISSAFTNQGNILFTSGNSYNQLSANTLTIYDNYNQFEIQLSSSTPNTTVSYPIKNYSFSAVSNYYLLNFELIGILTATTTDAIYIRPSKKRYFQYKRSISNIEYQLLENGIWSVPDSSTDKFFQKTIEWPRSIDGFAPDSYGTNFDNYQKELLYYANLTDQIKTNWMVRAIVPETFLELDSDGQIYRKLIQTFSTEFDQIKEYIDGLAYAHSINYTEKETIPNKFLNRLSNLLGWKEPINFTDVDFFEFLGQEDDNNKSLEDYNLDIWRRILTNINWLYKRKGTRDAIMFIFKIIGAPECLVNFDEFVYRIERSSSIIFPAQSSGGDQSIFDNQEQAIGKVNNYGYINYTESEYKFQEGGPGRGNGQDYINQWRPEFDPIKTVDNIKVYTGDSVFGTQNLVNTKEVSIGLDPASAIECDVFDWYKLGFFYTGNTSVSLPSDYKITNISEDLIAPPEISGWTISQWLNYVYNNSIDPKTRKTSPEPHHNYFYPNLRKIYLTYYYWNVNQQVSNMITFRKLEQFLRLVESKVFVYLEQVIPATTIFEGVSTIYRNTVFNRQKFVYPKGINDGSEFQIKKSPDLYSPINGYVISSKINNVIHPKLNSFIINSNLQNQINLNFSTIQTQLNIFNPIAPVINAVSVTANLFSAQTKTQLNITPLLGNIILFPLSGIPIGTPPPIPTPYTGNTGSSGGGVPYNPQQNQD